MNSAPTSAPRSRNGEKWCARQTSRCNRAGKVAAEIVQPHWWINVAMGDIRSVVDWLTDGARSGSLSEDVLAELCRRMVDGGIPLWRVAVFVNTLHPDVIGRAFIWQVDT